MDFESALYVFLYFIGSLLFILLFVGFCFFIDYLEDKKNCKKYRELSEDEIEDFSPSPLLVCLKKLKK